MMSDLRARFGERLKRLRQQRGMTQEQLAEASKLSVDFVSQIERGVSAPSFESLERLAKALDVAVKDCFDFTGLSRGE